MKTILYTGHNELYKPLADITVPRMAEYAERHGMDFTCYTEPLLDVPNGEYWTGVCGALKAFKEGYDRAFYLDADQLVTNMDRTLMVNVPDGFYVSRDWGNDAEYWHQFSMCGFLATPWCADLFKHVLDSEPEWRYKPFPEQAPMQLAALEWNKMEKFSQSRFSITTMQRRVFNAVPDLVSPGNVPEPWKPRDWCAHITMVPIERRIEIAKEILKTL